MPEFAGKLASRTGTPRVGCCPCCPPLGVSEVVLGVSEEVPDVAPHVARATFWRESEVERSWRGCRAWRKPNRIIGARSKTCESLAKCDKRACHPAENCLHRGGRGFES